jgi:hypothetical protein
VDTTRRRLEANVYPRPGVKPIAEIEAPDWWQWPRQLRNAASGILPSHLDELRKTVASAYLLADKSRTRLKTTRTATGIDIALPGHAHYPIATVHLLKTN